MSIQIDFKTVLGMEYAIKFMRNPYESWDKSDSEIHFKTTHQELYIGNNDRMLMDNLCKAGPEHRKYMRMINAYFEIKAPLYWWKEFDTYKVGTVCNSSSTMHLLAKRNLTIDDFSTDQLFSDGVTLLVRVIEQLNYYRRRYNETGNKAYWYNMVQLLPSSYMQHRGVMLNYETLHNIYNQRKNHKLNEWHKFCDKLTELPVHSLITF